MILNFILLITLFSHSTDLRYINIDNIKNNSNYSQEIDFIWNNQKYLHSFYPDEYWKADQTKSYYSEYLKKFYEKLSKNPENESQDYLLLKALVAEYLYHLDNREYFEIAVADYDSIGKIKGRDYRYKWFLGKFYTKAARPYEGIAQYQFVLKKIPIEFLHPDFFLDYAYSLGLAMMPESAIYYYEEYQKVSKKSEKIELFEDIKKTLIADSSVENLDFENLFHPFEREDGCGLLSKLLGIWVPLRPEWGIQKTGLIDGVSVIKIKSGAIQSDSGNSITYSILLYSVLDSKKELKVKDSLPNLVKTSFDFDSRITIYEYSDETIYKDIGGSQGFLVEITVPYLPDSGIRIEQPSKVIFSEEEKGARYMPFQRQYLRYPGTIKHYLLLDTCNYIFKESKEQFFAFLKECLFE